MKVEIDGMHCQACVQRVRKTLERVEGVTVSNVEVGAAEVSADASKISAMIEAIRKAGFEARVSG